MIALPHTRLAAAILVTLLGGSLVYAQHGGDIWIGHTQAGQLTIAGFPVDEEFVGLEGVTGILNGWADNNPGFDHVVDPDPENDLYPLEFGVQVRLEVVELDPAVRLIDNSYRILDEPGDSTTLGGSTLHVHLTWHINSDDAAFDELRTLWRVTFILIDDGSTGYGTTEPITIRFHKEGLEWITGDVNDDGLVNRSDMRPFFAVLADPGSATEQERAAADTNLDGLVTDDDIGPFFALILRQSPAFMAVTPQWSGAVAP